MTKASITSSINSQLTAIITQVKHRLSMLDLVNALFPETVTESYTNLVTTVTNTAPIGTTHYYTTYWKKQGNIVNVKGVLTNKTGSTVSDENWITITTAEFLPNALPNLQATLVVGTSLSNYRPILMDIRGTTIKVITPIANNESVLIDVKYFAE